MDREKIVCGCRMVSHGKILDAIINGARTFEEVQAVTHVAEGCHRCEAGVRILIDRLIAEEKAAHKN